MTMYEQLGGDAAIDDVVDRFYRKVLKDPDLRPFFERIDMSSQRQKLRSFMTVVLGGPQDYSGRELRASHAGMALDDHHYDRMTALIAETLHEMSDDEMGIASAMKIIEIARDAILNR